ncbi:MAG TPA: inositol oxygenase family protein [Bryobacteraceae bacterium]|nr:inositol oxygenase family protein [Bryobacteraceae bacterium]
MSGPLQTLSQWDDHVAERYQPGKEQADFRRFDETSPARVREFYRLNHTLQTRDFVLQQKQRFGTHDRSEMTVWEALDFLNTLVDDSDPDTDLSQIEHNMQTAEAIRRDGHPRWMQLTGLIHDLGKILCIWGEPQWAVVGDTFPVGCAWSNSIVFHDYFRDNPDARVLEYQTLCGVYEPGCGLDKVDMSWGHDEYLYSVVKDKLPEPALYMIRYHSCYPIHREGAYEHLMDDKDRAMFEHVRAFNPYDLYSKSEDRVDIEALKPYYDDLINEYLPGKLRW